MDSKIPLKGYTFYQENLKYREGVGEHTKCCLLYTSDAADDWLVV